MGFQLYPMLEQENIGEPTVSELALRHGTMTFWKLASFHMCCFCFGVFPGQGLSCFLGVSPPNLPQSPSARLLH